MKPAAAVNSDKWSVREKLCLASSVLRSGEQNWVCVSRQIKPFAEGNRPSDWFSTKNCAVQYSQLLESAETPRRGKRGNEGVLEAAGVQIVRKLTQDRIDDLKKVLAVDLQEFRNLKADVTAIRNGEKDDQLAGMWSEYQSQRKSGETSADAVKIIAKSTPTGKPKPTSPVKKTPPKTVRELTEEHQQQQQRAAQLAAATSLPAVTTISSQQLISACNTVPNQPLIVHKQTTDSPTTTTTQLSAATQPAPSIATTESVTTTKIDTTVITPSNVTIIDQPPPPAVVIQPGEEVTETVVTDQMISSQTVPDTADVKTVDETVPESEPVETTQPPALLTEPLSAEAGTSTDSNDAFQRQDSKDSIVSRGESLSADDDIPEEKQEETRVASVEENEEGCIKLTIRKTTSPTKNVRSEQPKIKIENDDNSEEVTEDVPVRKTSEQDEKIVNNSNTIPNISTTSTTTTTTSSSTTTTTAAVVSTPSSTTGITADSIPNSPSISVCSDDTEPTREFRQWKKAILLLWGTVASHRYASIFLQPVNESLAPGYRNVVLRPLDLATIKRNVETGAIRTNLEFQRDVMLMFQNAIMYNSSDHDIYQMTLEMQQVAIHQIEEFLATQMMLQNPAEGKTLRNREMPSRRGIGDLTDKGHDETRTLRRSAAHSDHEGTPSIKKRRL